MTISFRLGAHGALVAQTLGCTREGNVERQYQFCLLPQPLAGSRNHYARWSQYVVSYFNPLQFAANRAYHVDQYELQVCRLPSPPRRFSFRCVSKLRRPTLRPGLFHRFHCFFFGVFGSSQVSLRLLKASPRVLPKSLRVIAMIISIELRICHSVISVRRLI